MSEAIATGDRPPKTSLEEQSDQQLLIASQWQLVRWRFVRHKLAVISLIVLCLFYLVAIFAEFVAPQDKTKRNLDYIYCPPQQIAFAMTFEKLENGKYVNTGWSFTAQSAMGAYSENTKMTIEKKGDYYVLAAVDSTGTMGGEPMITKKLRFTDWKFNDEVGAVIRCQAPLIRHVNDDGQAV